MKRKISRVVAFTLAGTMILGVTGCGGDSGTATTAATTSSGGEQKTTATGENKGENSGSGLNEVGTYPISNEKLQYKMFRLSMPNVEDFATNDFTKYMEELTNIAFTFETGTRDDAVEKLNMAFATGTYADCIMSIGPDEAKYGVKEGILVPLDDLIYENMPNYVEKMGEYIDSTRQTDGHIYSIASLNDCYHCMYGRKMWVNTKYLDEMGVGIPTTTQEFYDVCKKFVETYPGKIAVAGANTGWYVRFEEWLMNAFTLDPGKQQSFRDKTIVNAEGKVECAAALDEWRAGLAYMRSLYDLGAIYDGNFTQSSEQLRTLMNQEDEPILFVPFGTISDGLDAESNNEVYRHYQCMAPLKGPEGVQIATFFKYSGIGEGSFNITDKCDNPAALLRWVDYFFSEKGDISSQFGADEGTDWVWSPEGEVGLNGEPALYKISDSAQYSSETQNHDWQDVSIRYAPASFRLGQATDPNVDIGTAIGLEKLLYESTKNNMEPYAQKEGENDILPVLKFTADEITQIQTIGVEVENWIETKKVAFITGEWDINNDADWQKYLDGLKNAGVEKLIGVYQIAYDRQSGK